MQTVNERLAEAEERLSQIERGQAAMVSAAYAAVLAVVQTLKDNRAIQGVHLKLCREAMEQAVHEALAQRPDLLDQVKYGFFSRRWLND